MNKNQECDVCNGTDYNELNICYICNRHYCEICEGANSSTNICEICSTSDIYDEEQ